MGNPFKYALVFVILCVLTIFCAFILSAPGPSQYDFIPAPSSPVSAPASTELTYTPAPTVPYALLPDFSFGIIGGCAGKGGQYGTVNQAALTSAVTYLSDSSADFIVVVGDIATGSVFPEIARANLENAKSLWLEFFDSSRVYPVFGLQEAHHKGRNKILPDRADPTNPDNADKVDAGYKHDLFSEVFSDFGADSFFHDVYRRTVYAFTRGRCNFFVLNSKWFRQMDRISPAVINWLLDYSNNDADYNLVFMYGSPYPISDVGMEMDADFSTTTDDTYEKTNAQFRDELVTALKQLKNPIVFCGSESLYARRQTYGLLQISCSGLGYEFDRAINSDSGVIAGPMYDNFYIKCDVYDDSLEFSVIRLSDQSVVDSFKLK